MTLPGKATLELSLRKLKAQDLELRQVARFVPRGLFGLLYWYGVLPAHHVVFRSMLRDLARRLHCDIVEGPKRLNGLDDAR